MIKNLIRIIQIIYLFIKYDLELCDQFNNRLDNYKQIIDNEL